MQGSLEDEAIIIQVTKPTRDSEQRRLEDEDQSSKELDVQGRGVNTQVKEKEIDDLKSPEKAIKANKGKVKEESINKIIRE